MSETLRRRGRPPKQAQVQIQEQSPPEQTLPEKETSEHQEDVPVSIVHTNNMDQIDMSPTWTPIQVEDVVQVVNSETKNFGILFIVGDIKNHRVHGYYLLPNGKHEYITVNEDEVLLVGKKTKGHIRSKASCSPKWIAEGK